MVHRQQIKQSPPGGSSAQGLVTYLLEPQVGLHDLVYFILEREIKVDGELQKQGWFWERLFQKLHTPRPQLVALALTTFTS